MNDTICDRCGQLFTPDEFHVGMVKSGDLWVKYLFCPFCGTRYQIFTSDVKMRKLVERRKVVQLKLQAAHTKKFREKIVKKYIRELEQLKKAQEKMLPELKAAGEKILHGEGRDAG